MWASLSAGPQYDCTGHTPRKLTLYNCLTDWSDPYGPFCALNHYPLHLCLIITTRDFRLSTLVHLQLHDRSLEGKATSYILATHCAGTWCMVSVSSPAGLRWSPVITTLPGLGLRLSKLGSPWNSSPNRHLLPTLASITLSFNQSTYLLLPSIIIIISLAWHLTVYSVPPHILI